jgi:hypothetical protein
MRFLEVLDDEVYGMIQLWEMEDSDEESITEEDNIEIA